MCLARRGTRESFRLLSVSVLCCEALAIRLPLRPGLAFSASPRSKMAAPLSNRDTLSMVIPSGGSLSSTWISPSRAGMVTRSSTVPPAGIFTG